MQEMPTQDGRRKPSNSSTEYKRTAEKEERVGYPPEIKQCSYSDVQETKMDPETPDPHIPGYDLIRRDRNRNGGGVCTMVHEDLRYSSWTLENQEVIVCDVRSGAQILGTVNFYQPPNCDVNVEELFRAQNGLPDKPQSKAAAHSVCSVFVQGFE